MKKTSIVSLLLIGCLLLALAGCSVEKAPREPEDKPIENPGDQPAEKPESKPAEKPESKPAEKPESKPFSESGSTVVATYLDHSLTNDQLRYYYWDAYYGMLSANPNLQRMLDPTRPLGEQPFGESNTWQDYFINAALNQWLSSCLLITEGQRNGFTLSAEDRADLDGMKEEMTKVALDAGSADLESYLVKYYGEGANFETYAAYMENVYLSGAFGDSKAQQFLDEVRAAHTDPLPHTMHVRHILIKPADDTSDADWASADQQAKDVYAQWQKDPTEDHFAQLAAQYSADGNAAQGGIYRDVLPGQMVETFNDWCFDESRKAGDSGIVKTPYGYHIMYYVGQGEEYLGELEAQAGEKLGQWLQDLVTPNALTYEEDKVSVYLNADQQSVGLNLPEINK